MADVAIGERKRTWSLTREDEWVTHLTISVIITGSETTLDSVYISYKCCYFCYLCITSIS